jgi:hypothetical protein
MQNILRLVHGIASPVILIAVTWGATLIAVAIGPVDYSLQSFVSVLVLVAVGLSLFILADRAGAWVFRIWSRNRTNTLEPSLQLLNNVVAITSFAGLVGIGLIAFDRIILSGVGLSGYAELLRCAPGLVDFVDIRRTPLLYLGYLTFSFGFASPVLFLLRGEEIRGWSAILAQLSILSPIAYALIYAGRMPILFEIVLLIAAMLVRITQGRPPFPRGHLVLVKIIVVFALFVSYSSSMWSTRQSFCVQMGGLIQELQDRINESEHTLRPVTPVSAVDLKKMIEERKASLDVGKAAHSADIGALLATMQETWHARPRDYVLSAIASGSLSPNSAMIFLSTYFYLTHGVRILDLTWQDRKQFSPNWGIYEIGVLSPIIRVFLPQSRSLASLNEQLKSAEVYGFFPTVWAAAYIDFGTAGAVIYILIWGFIAGYSSLAVRHSMLVMPALLLTFVLTSIVLSPIQGPLGVANSALVFASMVAMGVVIDLRTRVSVRDRDIDGKA